MSKPTPIETLGVFLRYDDGSESPIEWSVYAGGLEGARRFYRIRYATADPDVKPIELTAVLQTDATNPEIQTLVADFRNRIHAWLDTMQVSQYCLNAVYSLLEEDPWMSQALRAFLSDVD